MDIFISWSGSRSGAVAKALHGLLPKIANAFDPFFSPVDIDQGSRWGADVAARLQAARAGIICITPENLHSDWILFEAGALSKTIENTFVCPVLVGLEPTDVKGPLAQFQATRMTRGDILKLLKTLNRGLGEAARAEGHITEMFGLLWPKLENELNKLPPEAGTAQPQRTERDLLEEILNLVRVQTRTAAAVNPIGDQWAMHRRRKAIMYEVLEAARGLVPNVDSTVGELRGSDFRYTVWNAELGQASGLTVVVPADTPPKHVAGLVRDQITSKLSDDGGRAGTTAKAAKRRRRS